MFDDKKKANEEEKAKFLDLFNNIRNDLMYVSRNIKGDPEAHDDYAHLKPNFVEPVKDHLKRAVGYCDDLISLLKEKNIAAFADLIKEKDAQNNYRDYEVHILEIHRAVIQTSVSSLDMHPHISNHSDLWKAYHYFADRCDNLASSWAYRQDRRIV